MTSPPTALPAVARIGAGAPFRWLGGAWSDLWRAPLPCLTYGLVLSLFSLWFTLTVYNHGASHWIFALTCGFVFVAPVLAMGLYEAGRRLENGERPSLPQMVFVRAALRQDLAYLGLALLLIYLTWGGIAQIVYGLSTSTIHRNLPDLIAFATDTLAGRRMVVIGSVIGGAIAFFAYCLVVVTAPMLLDRRNDVFIAVVTSVRTVVVNFWPMALWALILAALTLSTAATGFLALTVVFPWLGLASWRAFRELAPSAA
jgi:uncharacterized membrane protein